MNATTNLYGYLDLVDYLLDRQMEYYYQSDDKVPLLSDAEYDEKIKELKVIEKNHPEWVVSYSPTQRVAPVPVSNLEQVPRDIPMLSLDNVNSQEELADFFSELEAVVLASSKADGLATSIEYEYGILTRASTRGDGYVGEDITHNVRAIKNVPLRIPSLSNVAHIEVRGEIVVNVDDFNKFNEELVAAGEEPKKTPRAFAAGSARLLDARLSAKRNLRFLAYDIVGGEFETEFAKFENMVAYGFEAVSFRVCKLKYLVNMDDLEGIVVVDTPYETDGVVVKINKISEQKKFGSTTHHPKYAVAYKFPPEEKITKIISYKLQVGRTGKVTPVAHITPTNIGGTTVTKATLCNPEQIEKLGVSVGDTVIVRKAGEVIPEIVRVVERAQDRTPIEMERCPHCDSFLERKLNADGNLSADRFCLNALCEAQLERRLLHYASRGALDIEGLGKETAKALVDSGMVQDVCDIYDLTEDDLMSLPGFSYRKANNLHAQIFEKSKNVPLNKFIYSLGIEDVGNTLSKSIADYFGDYKRFRLASISEFEKIDGIARNTANNIDVSLDKLDETLNYLEDYVTISQYEKKKTISSKWAGKSVVITGSFSVARDVLKDFLEQEGANVKSSISKKTDFLFAGAKGGGKLTKAESLGVTIIHLDEAEELIAKYV